MSRRNVEDEERAMDYAWRESDHHHRGCLYDSTLDARSDARYETDPRAEPEQHEVDAARYEPAFECSVDESAGFRV